MPLEEPNPGEVPIELSELYDDRKGLRNLEDDRLQLNSMTHGSSLLWRENDAVKSIHLYNSSDGSYGVEASVEERDILKMERTEPEVVYSGDVENREDFFEEVCKAYDRAAAYQLD